jgi:hypothetical protein
MLVDSARILRLSACMYSGSSGKFSCPQRQSCSLVSPCFCTAHNRFRYKTLNLGKRQIYKSSRSNTFLFVVITECSIFMAYTDPLLASKHLRPVDIFTSHWRLLSLAGACYSYFKYLPIWWIPLILFKLLWQSRGTRTFITINQKLSPKISWLLYLYAVPVDDFETNFRQAWIEQLDSSRTGDDEVLMVNIFVGKESIPVPVLFNRNDEKKNRDAETFRQLRMWYFWLQYKGGWLSWSCLDSWFISRGSR